MQAVILAGGSSSRIYPLNNGTHKSMIKIMEKPILYFTIASLKKTGIKDLIIVTEQKSSIHEYFGLGQKFGVSITYVVQEASLGMGDALLLCKNYIKNDFLLLSASHVDASDFVNDMVRVKERNVKAVLLGKIRKTGLREGVLKFSGKKVEEIIEKPQRNSAPSDVHVVGIYLFEKDFLASLKMTDKEHYSLEKAISAYAHHNNVTFVETEKETVSLKYPWDLLTTKDYLFKDLKRKISKDSTIAESAEIIGDVFIEEGVSIMEGVRIKGPCYIGKNVKIGNNALLRQGVDVGENCVVGGFMEIKNTILMKGSTTHSGFIGDSVVSENCKIAAGFVTANVRLDRKTISARVKSQDVDTGRKYFGTVIGANADVGIKSSTMPGIIIGKNVTIGPSTVVMTNVPDDTKYYTKFQEVVVKKKVEKPIVFFDIDYTLFDTDHFKESKLLQHKVYEEVVNVLNSLSKTATLGIFSEGDLDFQIEKLTKTDIKKYFDEIHTHIVLDKLSEIKRVFDKYKNNKLFLVDDKLSILKDLKNFNSSIFTIWVKRGRYAKAQKEIAFKPDAEVENLSEIVRLVQSQP